MIAEAILVDTSQAQAQLVQQQQQQQMQQQVQMQQQQQTTMQAQSPMQSGAMQSGPMQSGPMQSGPMQSGPMQINGSNGTTSKPGRMNSGDGCCDNARERAKDAVAKVAPCACKSYVNQENDIFCLNKNLSQNLVIKIDQLNFILQKKCIWHAIKTTNF